MTPVRNPAVPIETVCSCGPIAPAQQTSPHDPSCTVVAALYAERFGAPDFEAVPPAAPPLYRDGARVHDLALTRSGKGGL